MPDVKIKGLVPHRRFPEFRDAGPWEVKRLGEVCDVLQGYGFPERLQGKQQGKYPFCKVSDITNAVSNTGGHIKDAANYIDDEDVKELRAKPIPKGATIFAKIGEALRLNKRAFVETECLIDNNVVGLKGRNKQAIDYFVFFLSQKIDLNKHCGGAVPSVNKSTLQSIKVVVPHVPEQQKIADCLSSLDDLIRAEEAQLAALKEHKKGLMQQLFPAPGETTPRLRFPEFRGAGPWEVKKIEDCFEVRSSKRVLQKYWQTEGVPFYRTRELVSLQNNEPFNSQVYISEELFYELAKEYGVPAEGDFLVSGVGTLGIAYQVRAGDRFYFKDGNVLWFKKKGNVVSQFFNYCFESSHVQEQIVGHASVSTVGTYTIEKAKETVFACPSIEAEQKKIADCLSSLDNLIRARAARIEALKTHKRGLMQQLFPSLDGVRG